MMFVMVAVLMVDPVMSMDVAVEMVTLVQTVRYPVSSLCNLFVVESLVNSDNSSASQ